MTERILELEHLVKTLVEENHRLKERITQLEGELARARKNSSTSSKPPSSDLVKPPKKPLKATAESPRKAGGQHGHPKHERGEFPPERLDTIREYHLDRCPQCGSALEDAENVPQRIQQVEIVAVPIQIEEHRGHAFWCPSCRTVHYAPFPATVEQGGLFGPRLTTLVAYLKGVCHASFSTIRKFLRDVIGVRVSRGYLRKLIAKMSAALRPSFEALLAALPAQPAIHIDETGHHDTGDRWWTWCFTADLYTLFRIDPSRGSQVLMEVLGTEFTGVIGCDYFSAYRKYMRLNTAVAVQFCLAHLIRDVKYLTTLRDAPTQAYGERLRQALKSLFSVIHQREALPPLAFQQAMEAARNHVVAEASHQVPPTNEAQNMATRFKKHGAQYFQFMTTPNIAPTNNLAEQAIRFVVIDRHITQGTRSASGRQWCERIWTVIATCAQRGRDIFEFLHQSLLASWNHVPGPSLLQDSG